MPHGAETYRNLVRYHTTTDLTPDVIFELGEREVARISGEMEAVMRRARFQGSLREFFDHVLDCVPESWGSEKGARRHCLLTWLEAAVHAIESGRFAHSEPGPYRIIAVHSVPSG